MIQYDAVYLGLPILSIRDSEIVRASNCSLSPSSILLSAIYMSSRTHTKNPGRVAAGLKATIHNPNVFEEAKVRARQRLAELEEHAGEVGPSTGPSNDLDIVEYGSEDFDEIDSVEQSLKHREATEHHILGGYRAAINNPKVSVEAKEHARKVLEESGAL